MHDVLPSKIFLLHTVKYIEDIKKIKNIVINIEFINTILTIKKTSENTQDKETLIKIDMFVYLSFFHLISFIYEIINKKYFNYIK